MTNSFARRARCETGRLMDELAAAAGDDFCYLTTLGRVSGRPHEIEIWFALDSRTLYLLSGGNERSDWVRNLRAEPSVTVRVRDTTYDATGRVVGAGKANRNEGATSSSRSTSRATAGASNVGGASRSWSRSTYVGQTDRMAIELVPLCRATITLKDPMVLPNTPSGMRTIIEVEAAKLEGERLSGSMKGAAGADWAPIRPHTTS